MSKVIEKAIDELRTLRRLLVWKQRIYKHDKLNYYCEVKNMSALTNDLKPKSRESSTLHNLTYCS